MKRLFMTNNAVCNRCKFSLLLFMQLYEVIDMINNLLFHPSQTSFKLVTCNRIFFQELN